MLNRLMSLEMETFRKGLMTLGNSPFKAFVRRWDHEVRRQMEQESLDVLVEQCIHFLRLNGALNIFGGELEKSRMEFLKSRIQLDELLEAA